MNRTGTSRLLAVLIAFFLVGSPSLTASPAPAGSGATASSPAPAEDGVRVVRAYYRDHHQVDEMASWLEPWEVHPGAGYVVVAVTPDETTRLLDAGFRLEVDEQRTEALARPLTALDGQLAGIPGYPCYRTVAETYAAAAAIAATHPVLASWLDVGDSWEKVDTGGSSGHDLKVLRLTNSAVPGPKPSLFVMSGLHAREYAPVELATRLAEYLVDNYGRDPDVTWLLDYQEIHLLLEANPDGRIVAESTTPLWRKNTDDDDGCLLPNSWGTDLNRNFEFQWSLWGGSSGAPCSETYRGPAPASEPETSAVQEYLRALFPDQRAEPLAAAAPDTTTGLFVDLHSYGGLVLWPWGFTGSPAPNGTALQTLGRKLAYYNGYLPEQAIALYATDGASDDFAYGDLGIAACSFEVGTEFFQDCTAFVSTLLPGNLAALLYAAKAARTPYRTPAGPDALDLAVSPARVVAGQSVHLTAAIDDTRYGGQPGAEPVQSVVAAEYTVDAPPWLTATLPISGPMTALDGVLDGEIEGVEALLDTSGWTGGRHTVFVRGRDAAGNWGAPSAVFVTLLHQVYLPLVNKP